MLFEALRSVTVTGVTLDVAGDGDPAYVAELRRLAPEGVRFLGPVYGDEKWRLIREADIVVLPSHSENYGLIVAEALASGTPVITTTGTPWQAVADRRCGWWVEPKPEALRQALAEALEGTTAADLEAMGRRARRLAEEECSVQQVACQLVENYRQNLSV